MGVGVRVRVRVRVRIRASVNLGPVDRVVADGKEGRVLLPSWGQG